MNTNTSAVPKSNGKVGRKRGEYISYIYNRSPFCLGTRTRTIKSGRLNQFYGRKTTACTDLVYVQFSVVGILHIISFEH